MGSWMGFHGFHQCRSQFALALLHCRFEDKKHTGHTHEHVRSQFQCVTMNAILAPESPNNFPEPESLLTSSWHWRLRIFILVENFHFRSQFALALLHCRFEDKNHTGHTHEHVRSKFQCVTMNVILAPESPNNIPEPESHLTSSWHWRLRITRVLGLCAVLYIKRMLNCLTSNTTGILFSVVLRGDFWQGWT
jgi:hypothetical protein